MLLVRCAGWSFRMVRLFFLAATALIVFGGGGGMVVVVHGQEVVRYNFCGCDFLRNTSMPDMRELYREKNCVFQSGCSSTWLYLSWYQLTSIAPGTFDGLGSLFSLDLSNNQLTSLAPGAFDGLGSLTELNLCWNQLTSIAPGTFDGLGRGTRLDVSGNPLGGEVVPDWYRDLTARGVMVRGVVPEVILTYCGCALTAGGMRELYREENCVFQSDCSATYLDLNSIQFTSIAPGTFDGLGNLTYLGLGGNRLTSIAPGTFDGLGSLTDLDLYGNQLTSLAPGAFDGLGSLTELNLNDNQLTSLAPGTFDGLGSLKYLDLGWNPLSGEVPEWYKQLKAKGVLIELGDVQFGTCPKNYYLFQGECRECDAWGKYSSLVFGIAGVVVLVLYFKFTSWIHEQTEDMTVLKDLQRTARDFLTHLQVISIIVISFDVDWPDVVQRFGDMLASLVRFDFFEMSNPECTVSLTYTARYGVRAGISFVPTILLATVAIWSVPDKWLKVRAVIDKVFSVCIFERIGSCWLGKSSENDVECTDTATTSTETIGTAVRSKKKKWLGMAWSLYEATLLPVLLIAFEAVDCNWTTSEKDFAGDPLVVLDASPQIRCRNNLKWTRFPLVFSSLFIMVSVVITHILFAYALRCVQKGTASIAVEAAFKPITEQFKENHWWWVFVSLLKKASISIAALVLSERPEWQVGGTGMLLFGVLMLSFILNPYLKKSDSYNEKVDYGVELVQIILAGIALKTSEDDEEISLIISVVFYIVMVVDMIRIGYKVHGQMKKALLARSQKSAQSTSIDGVTRWAEPRPQKQTQEVL